MKGSEGFRRTAYGIGILAVLWIVVSLITGKDLVPMPWTAFARFVVLLGEELWKHTLASLARVLASLVTATVVAFPLGILLGRSRRITEIITPALYLLYPVPKIALLPVIMLLFGVGNSSKVIVVFLVLFFQILFAVRDKAAGIPDQHSASVRSLGGGGRDNLVHVIIPAVLPGLLTGLRISSGTALAVLFFAETFFARYGLGKFILDSWMKVAYVDMFAGIIGLSLLGLLLFLGFDRLERRYCRWQRLQ
jgi:NitT/TauT family transport system permease protein